MSRSLGGPWVIAAVPILILVILLVPSGIAAPSGGARAPQATHATLAGPAAHPSARWTAPMTYDAKDGYALLFGGGASSKALSDTWTYKTGVWTKLALASHPSARGASSLVYDVKDQVVLLFGGTNGVSELGDTWIFTLGSWTKLNLTVAPSPRYGAGIAYDVKDGYVVLFGGQGPSTILSDTWTFVHGHWKQLTPTTSPPPRRSGGMTYDVSDGYVLLFGGLSYSDTGDTWTFAAGVWTQLALTTAPGVRVAPAMTYDSIDGHVLLFGGRDDNSSVLLGDFWMFHGGVWTLKHTSLTPSARQWPAFTFDRADHDVLMFGGGSSLSSPPSDLSDTHTFSAGAWT